MTKLQQFEVKNGSVRATWAEVNLTRLKNNLDSIRKKVFPAKIMVVVKANAYGHGLPEVTQYLAPYVDFLGVAVLEEGITLRQMGIKAPILVLGGVWGDQIPLYIKNDLSLSASSVERLVQIDNVASEMKIQAKIHLKIDTGMERIGVHYYSAELLQEAALKCKNIIIEGIYSHFANADSLDLTHARLQVERFEQVLDFYRKNDLPKPLSHMANSAAILQLPESYYGMVRPGILLYGIYPTHEIPRSVLVQPALAWKSRVVYFKVVKAGHPVSYGSTWQSDHLVRVVTVPVGYGDGYFRAMSNKAMVILNGKKYCQVGRICMDQIMINIEWDSAYNGDEVVLLGENGNCEISASDLAEWADTIPYEILTNINPRVPRIYITE